MSDRRPLPEREREELKCVIRSIVESNGNRVTLRSLSKEYKDINGSALPFARFGYESLLELIKDFEDTFGVEIEDRHRYESDYVVYCLPNANTKHIVDLVQNQRREEERHMAVIQPLINGFGHKTNVSNIRRQKIIKPFKLNPKQNSVEDKNEELNGDINALPSLRNGNQKQRPVQRAVCPLPDSRFITNDEKNNICQLMAKYSSINLLNFAAIYHLFHKKAIDFERFGYKTLNQFLSQMPELIQLVPSSDGIRVVRSQRNDFMPNGLEKGQSNGTTNGLTKSNGYSPNHFIQKKDLDKFFTILRRNPNGIPVHQFIEDYYKTFGKPFLSDIWGFGSAVEMFSILKDIFCLKKPPNNSPNLEEWILLESTPQLRAQIQISFAKKKRFDKNLKDNVNELMIKMSKTTQRKELFVEEFSDAYYLCFDQTIDPKIYGFNDLKQLLMSLSKECDFDVKEKIKSKPFVVYSKKFID